MKGQEAPGTDRIGITQMRAFALCDGCGFAGKTVDSVEAAIENAAEVEKVYRGGAAVEMDQAVLCRDDVLLMIGDLSALEKLDELGLREVSDSRYFQIENTDAQIVLTEEADEKIHSWLTRHGIYIKEVESRGRRVRNPKKIDLKKGDVLHV